tara:strand:+ start:2970 stop:4262 length:1293 start_codon:yes stop_codon:yes gene_type:complete
MPLGIARSVLTTASAADIFNPIVDSQAIASRYVAGSDAFNFVGYDTSTNPIFIVATHTSTKNSWGYVACKYDYSADTWSFGSEVSVGINTDQASASVVSKARGSNRYLAPPSGASIYAIGNSMGGTAGSQDNIEWFRLTVDTSTLAITKGSTYNSGDIYVPSGPYENVNATYTDSADFTIIKRGSGSSVQFEVRNTTDANPPVLVAQDLNGYAPFSCGGESANNRLSGMALAADNGRWATSNGCQNGGIYFHNLHSTSTFTSSTLLQPTGVGRGSYGQKRFMCHATDTTKMAWGYHNAGTTDAYIAGATVTWVNGAAPTSTSIAAYVTHTVNDAYELTESFNNDTIYGINYNGTALGIQEIAFSGNTPTVGSTIGAFTISATPASSGVQDIYARSPVDTLNDSSNSRKMIAGAYTDASGNVRVWATKYLL